MAVWPRSCVAGFEKTDVLALQGLSGSLALVPTQGHVFLVKRDCYSELPGNVGMVKDALLLGNLGHDLNLLTFALLRLAGLGWLLKVVGLEVCNRHLIKARIDIHDDVATRETIGGVQVFVTEALALILVNDLVFN